MAGFNGRQLVFDWDSTTLVGVQSKTMNMQNELVDVTTDDDAGWRTLLADPGMKMLSVDISGVTSDEVLIAEYFNSSVTGETMAATLPTSLASAGSVSGTFMVESLSYEANHDGSVNFSATFQSSGEITYTASSA